MTSEQQINSILSDITTTYAVEAPQNTIRPYVVFAKISPGRDYTHDGYSGLARIRIQVNCYGDSYQQAKMLANQIILAVEANLPGSRLSGEFDGKSDGVYITTLEFTIKYKED